MILEDVETFLYCVLFVGFGKWLEIKTNQLGSIEIYKDTLLNFMLVNFFVVEVWGSCVLDSLFTASILHSINCLTIMLEGNVKR